MRKLMLAASLAALMALATAIPAFAGDMAVTITTDHSSVCVDMPHEGAHHAKSLISGPSKEVDVSAKHDASCP
ncbi:MAG: hypothetical protein HY533_05845 [Chloroflexi bacterium]|nr:hypothetical protein [Chloroflexota bacterium]